MSLDDDEIDLEDIILIFFLIFCQGKLHLKLTVFFFLLLLVVVDYYHLPLFYPHPT